MMRMDENDFEIPGTSSVYFLSNPAIFSLRSQRMNAIWWKNENEMLFS